jgi:hypothetical protein
MGLQYGNNSVVRAKAVESAFEVRNAAILWPGFGNGIEMGDPYLNKVFEALGLERKECPVEVD